jgi:hypothetical protein
MGKIIRQYAVSQHQDQQQQLIDLALDYIRENKLHPLIDFIASYIVMIICIVYYILSYLQTLPKTASSTYEANHDKIEVRWSRWFASYYCCWIAIDARDNTPVSVPLITEPHTRSFSAITNSSSSNNSDTRDISSFISKIYEEVNQLVTEFYDTYNNRQNAIKYDSAKKENALSKLISGSGDDCEDEYDIEYDSDDNRTEDSFVVVDDDNDTNVNNNNDDEFQQSMQKTETRREATISTTNATTDDDMTFIQTIRSSLTLRRVATRFISKYQILLDFEAKRKGHDNKGMIPPSSPVDHKKQEGLYMRLQAVWIYLLRLPSFPVTRSSLGCPSTVPIVTIPKTFGISVVIPAYRERGEKIAFLLNRALNNCTNPISIQIIVVHADNSCPDLLSFINESSLNYASSNKDVHQSHTVEDLRWGEVRIIPYSGGGGRGPCLNAGAKIASGEILTFVHSDTMLPAKWDQTIRNALLQQDFISSDTDDSIVSHKTPIYHASVFRYGIDTSVSGLDGMGYPWGVFSVTLLGRLRSWLCRLPYGDHVISIPAIYFDYIGGYPNQPMMEDYDIMDLLRRRSKIVDLNEDLIILPGQPVLCSPRRWQKFGVVYCTAVNAMLVYRYARGTVSPQDIYNYYYNRQPSHPSTQQSRLESDAERKNE